MKPYYYIHRVGFGQPKAKYDTAEQAEAESHRLAAQHPGSAFEILECIASVQTTKPATFWMDGKEPVKTSTIDPGEGWRLLEVGEVIQKGDEILLLKKWGKSYLDGDRVEGATFRRRTERPWIDHDGGGMPCNGSAKVQIWCENGNKPAYENAAYWRDGEWNNWIGENCPKGHRIIKWREAV